MRVVEKTQDGFGSALQADTAVAITDDCVVLCDGGLGGDDATEAASEDLLEDGGID